MKILLPAFLLLAPIAVHAACAPTDFAVTNFQVSANNEGLRKQMIMKGDLVNHCAAPAAAQIQIEAKDASGNVLQTKKGWPAGTTNIAPGQSASFNLGRMFHYQSDMQTYAVTVVSVRSW